MTIAHKHNNTTDETWEKIVYFIKKISIFASYFLKHLTL